MQTHNTVKELLKAYSNTFQVKTGYKFKQKEVDKIINQFMAYNNLALGKREPLTKNKQTEYKCACGANERIAKDCTMIPCVYYFKNKD